MSLSPSTRAALPSRGSKPFRLQIQPLLAPGSSQNPDVPFPPPTLPPVDCQGTETSHDLDLVFFTSVSVFQRFLAGMDLAEQQDSLTLPNHAPAMISSERGDFVNTEKRRFC